MPANPTPYSWINIAGMFDQVEDEIIFRGYDFTPRPLPSPKALDDKGLDKAAVEQPQPPPEPRGGVGQCMSNQRFTEGSICVDVTFDDIDPNSTAEIILDYDPGSGDMLNAGIGAGSFLTIRQWIDAPTEGADKASSSELPPLTKRWVSLRQAGELRNLKKQWTYRVELDVRGSLLTVLIDGVELLSGNLQFPLAGRQVGLFCQSRTDIHFRNFEVKTKKPMAFVVMQLHPPEYEELFHKVIVPVCEKLGLEAFRSSQTFEPGLIIADIQRTIRQSRVVIAEISPVNPNVYYEVGFADAIGKPLILVADGAKVELLPFDVRGFRTIFYENTIGGKELVEEMLTEYLKNIMGRRV